MKITDKKGVKVTPEMIGLFLRTLILPQMVVCMQK